MHRFQRPLRSTGLFAGLDVAPRQRPRGAVWAFLAGALLCHHSLGARQELTETSAPQARRCQVLLQRAAADPRLELVRAEDPANDTVIVQGWYRVPEDRTPPPASSASDGPQIRLRVVVIPARSADRAEDPVFVLHGGPGAGATALYRQLVGSWMRQRRDIVLIDQRGTGGSNRLQVPGLNPDQDLQSYFHPMFDPELFRAALPALQERAQLEHYTTADAVDDFDEVRRALGYQQINLRGGSYGTRSALVFMRRHPGSIRSATLQGVQPIAYRNPLPHSRGAQEALDLVFAGVRAEPRAAAAYPGLKARFQALLQRLEESPAEVQIRHPETRAAHTVRVDRAAFAECVRIQLYTAPTIRRLPLLLWRATEGELEPLVQAGLERARGLRGLIAFGTLMCVVASEDLCRIDPSEIEPACAGTFAGDTRVRRQMAIAEFWPHRAVPPEFAEPVSVDVPTLLWSGTHDPVTTPAWGAEAARHLPNSRHVVVAGGHGVSGPAVDMVEQAFLEAASVLGLDTSAVEAIRLPPFALPAEGR